MDDPRTFEEHPTLVTPRSASEWAEMGLLTQANLVVLVVQQCRRARVGREAHEITTPSPGTIRARREHLLDPQTLRGMPDHELSALCRSTWGQLSAFCWLFGGSDPNLPPDFHTPPPSPRCAGEVALRVDWVTQTLWRIRFEQHLRLTSNFRLRPDFHSLRLAASRIEADVYGRPVHLAPPELLAVCACETAGVLAALRWAMDIRWRWDDREITLVGLD